ncbi:MAG: glycine cleavage system protein H [Acidimicrobiales bacterium]
MQTWRGCAVPEDLLYDVERNVWVRLEGNTAVVGMTDVSQTMCGRFVEITWRGLGRTIARGRTLAVVESAKWVGPFPAPLTGVLIENNDDAFAADIAVANRDPYGAGWLVRIEPTSREEISELVDATVAYERYKDFINDNDIHCFRCED